MPRNHLHSRAPLERLEPRTLFAVDFSVSSLVVAPTFVYTADILGRLVGDIALQVRNNGNTDSSHVVDVDVIYSKDNVIGNGDDFIDANALDFFNLPAETSTLIDDQGSVAPEELPAGSYYVGVRIDGGGFVAESNESNNVAVTATPVVTVITNSWPGGATLAGSAGDDVISVVQPNGAVFVTINGVTRAVGEIQPDSVFIDAGSGNDKVIVDLSMETRMLVTGSGGHDTIQGGAGDDELSGANGRDKVFGGAGDDYLLGGANKDYLFGEFGSDTMSGAGGNDRLADVEDKDWFIGGGGNDVLISRDEISNQFSDPDTVSGGAGTDSAQVDEDDLLASIESQIA